MRAHSAEPTLSWPTQGRRVANRPTGAETGWSSANVVRSDRPLARVAALLLSISQNNRYEGRDAKTVPDALTSGFVADLLGVDIGTLAALLVDLRRRGLVEGGPDGTLQLKDVEGLQQLVN
jgi:CRP-like cAMP-binding protein